MSQTIVFGFGKHKGKSIGDVPTGYLQWVAEAFDNDRWKAAAQRELLRRLEHPKQKRNKCGRPAGHEVSTHKPYTDPNGKVHMIPMDWNPSPDEECPFEPGQDLVRGSPL